MRIEYVFIIEIPPVDKAITSADHQETHQQIKKDCPDEEITNQQIRKQHQQWPMWQTNRRQGKSSQSFSKSGNGVARCAASRAGYRWSVAQSQS